MRIAGLSAQDDGDRSVLSAEISWREGRTRVRIAAPGGCIPDEQDASPFLAAAVLPAMLAAEDLEVASPVSPRLLAAVDTIAAAYAAWDPRLRLPELIAPVRRDPRPQADGTACFFSRGADSMASRGS